MKNILYLKNITFLYCTPCKLFPQIYYIKVATLFSPMRVFLPVSATMFIVGLTYLRPFQGIRIISINRGKLRHVRVIVDRSCSLLEIRNWKVEIWER